MTKHLLGFAMRRLAVTASIGSIAAMSCAGTASAQTAPVSLPALPMADALQRIQATTGKSIAYDPDAVSGLTSAPVTDARSADAAVRQAVRGTPLVIARGSDGAITVTSDVLIVAQRDEAEVQLLVRDATTSTRTGQSLRDQPRNTQVLSSRLIKEQQAQTLVDVLRNAGGVSVNTATVQGGISYSVRGFASGGVTNGLPSAASSGFAAGATQPISNVERVEVLKGPDALLAGAANLGGTVNIVTKKPSAQERLYVSAEVGSFGQVRGTIDANNALNDDRTLSARIIAAAASADRNYGGYRGNEDYLFAPSLRFKNANTDIVVGASLGNQIFGLTPFVPLNPDTNQPFAVPRDRPVLGLADQSTQIQTTQFYGEVTQKAADWLTLVARGQHQKLSLDIRQYSPLVVLAGDGTLLLTNGNTRQEGNSDAIDAYARFAVATGPVGHTLTAGYTYVENDLTALSSNLADFFPFNILTEELPMAPLAPVNSRDYQQSSTQNGSYAQYLAKVWKISVLAGVRYNKFRSSLTTFFRPRTVVDSGSATTPNFGAVFDVTDNLALFGSLSYGYSPTFAPDRAGNRLPDVETKNTEAGVKIDLFDDRLLINASWFRLRQGVSIITDPSNPRFQIAVPGQQGTGIDLNVTGEILPGWTVQGSLTRTNYRMLTPSAFGDEVVAQPRDQYSLYSAYRHKLGDELTAGLGAGVYGRSSAAVDSFNSYRVPPARQVDLNAFLTVGRFDVNLGVRNLFDRDNYNITYSPSFIPLSEPRNVRLTVGYRFR